MLKRSQLLIVLSAAAARYRRHSAQDLWKRSSTYPHSTAERGTTQLLIAFSVSPVNSRVSLGSRDRRDVRGDHRWRFDLEIRSRAGGAESLQFRDVQGVSDQVAYLMSIGENTGDFRIYKTGRRRCALEHSV